MIRVRNLIQTALVVYVLGLSSARVTAQEKIDQQAILADLETLKEAPQRLWAKPIVFQDVLKNRPDSKYVKINDEKYYHFRTEGIGDVYVSDLAIKDLREMEIGNDLIYTGTVLNRRGAFYIIANKVLKANSNPNGPVSSLIAFLNIDEDIRQHQAHQAIKNLLDVAQADMLVYARKNKIPFRELFNPDSPHGEVSLNIIRDAIKPLRNEAQMKPEELLAQVVNLALAQHYTSGGDIEPDIDLPEDLISATKSPVIAPAAPVKMADLPAIPPLKTADAIVATTPVKSSTTPAANAVTSEKVSEDLDDLISKLGSPEPKTPIVIGESRAPDLVVKAPKSDPKSTRELMKELETVDKSVVTPSVSLNPPQPVTTKVTDSENLLNDIESVLADSTPKSAGTPTPPKSTEDELDLLLKTVEPGDKPMVAKVATPTPAPAKAPALDPNAPVGRKADAATSPMRAIAADDALVAEPAPKKRGLFGRMFGSNNSEEPAPEVIELASTTNANLENSMVEKPAPAAQKNPRDDFEFQLSPIPRRR